MRNNYCVSRAIEMRSKPAILPNMIFFGFSLIVYFALDVISDRPNSPQQLSLVECPISVDQVVGSWLLYQPKRWEIFASGQEGVTSDISVKAAKWPGQNERGCLIEIDSLGAKNDNAADWRIGWVNNAPEQLAGKTLKIQIKMISDRDTQWNGLGWYLALGSNTPSFPSQNGSVNLVGGNLTVLEESVVVPEDALDFQLWLRLRIQDRMITPTSGRIWFSVHFLPAT